MYDKNLVNTSENIDTFFYKDTPDTYAGALEKAVEIMKKRRVARGCGLKRRYILFVPDKYTLRAEQLLYGGGNGSFDSEVLTLNRLYFRLAEEASLPVCEKPLSRLGAILTVRKILGSASAKLKCFEKSSKFAGFGETMYDNICQLAASGLRSSDLPDDMSGLTGYKIRDIKLVYAEYEKATRGKYVDSVGRLVLLEKLLDSACGFFENTDVYFACFDEFTPLMSRIVNKICVMCRKAGNEAVIFGAKCNLDIKGDVEEYVAPTSADELKAAAARIRNLAMRGVKYGEMGVIAPNADFNRLERIFDEYEIPFFTDKKYPLSSHPLAKYILDLFATALNGTNENYIKLSKNPYSGISPADSDAFENYVYYFSLCEGSMNRAFELEPEDKTQAGILPAAESVRFKLRKLVSGINRKEIACGKDFARAIERAMPENEAEISASLATPISDAKERITACAEVLGEVFAAPEKFDNMLSALEEGFVLSEVSVLPNLSDTVEVGEVPVFRASRYKYLFVLGMHEGDIPAVMRDEGMLCDKDIDALSARNARIEPKIESLNKRAEAELCSVLSSSENLFLSYCADCAPSQFLMRVGKNTKGKVVFAGTDDERARLFEESRKIRSKNKPINPELLLSLCPTRASARELYFVGEGMKAAGGNGLGFESELKAATGEKDYDERQCSEVKEAHKLYGFKHISVSRVQEYFACPRRCLLRYGLKLAPRPDGRVSPLDLGTYLHKVIELFVNECAESGDYSCCDRKIEKITERILSEYPQMLRGASDGFIKELKEEAAELAEVAAMQIKSGNFTPAFTEKEFGKGDGGFKGLEIALSGGNITLSGIIDRFDVSGNAARIVDYKTGRTDFSYSDIYYGKKLQLAIYLKVAEINGYTPAGMFYFPFSSSFVADRNANRLKGIFDSDYAYEMDNSLSEPQYASSVVAAVSTKDSADGHIVLRKGGGAVTASELKAVCDYAEAAFKSGAEEMLSGRCEASPLVSGNSCECDYCEVKAACSALGGGKRERKKASVGQDFLIESIEAGKSDGE